MNCRISPWLSARTVKRLWWCRRRAPYVEAGTELSSGVMTGGSKIGMFASFAAVT